jgi:integrase
MISLLRNTGIRIGEALALRWRFVDLEIGILKIAHTVTVEIGEDPVSGRHGSKIGPPKTRAGRREAAIGAAGVTQMKAWQSVQEGASLAAKRNRIFELKEQLGSNVAVGRELGISETAVQKRIAAAVETGSISAAGDLFVFGTGAGETWQLASNFWAKA